MRNKGQTDIHMSAEEAPTTLRAGEEGSSLISILETLAPVELDALIRFYSRGESPGDICRETGLTIDEFSQLRQTVRRRFKEARRGNGDQNL